MCFCFGPDGKKNELFITLHYVTSHHQTFITNRLHSFVPPFILNWINSFEWIKFPFFCKLKTASMSLPHSTALIQSAQESYSPFGCSECLFVTEISSQLQIHSHCFYVCCLFVQWYVTIIANSRMVQKLTGSTTIIRQWGPGLSCPVRKFEWF